MASEKFYEHQFHLAEAWRCRREPLFEQTPEGQKTDELPSGHKDYDLFYTSETTGRKMAAALIEPGCETRIVGPFSASEAGPLIVTALLEFGLPGLSDRGDIERHYTCRHFAYMAAGENASGMAYPQKMKEPS